MQILYKGKDIYNDISVNSCFHDMYADGHSDTLFLRFNDTRRLWDGWQASEEETISLIDGTAKTGKMFIKSVVPQNALYTLRASSTPPALWDKTNKSWEQVRLLQIVQEIAGRCGLSFEQHDVSDQVYEYVRQAKIPDALFLRQRCALEGAAFLIYDGKLVLYDEAAMESQSPHKTLEVDIDGDFTYMDRSGAAYSSAEIINGKFTGTFQGPNEKGGLYRRVVSTQISSQGEADRFAEGLLRYVNKNMATGSLKTTIVRDLAAGSVMNLKTEGAASWDGPAFLYHIRHDYISKKSKLIFRKPLEGY